MILSNVEIHKALDDGRLVIDPEPSPRVSISGPCPYDAHSVDLRLGCELAFPQAGQFCYDLTLQGTVAQTIEQHSEQFLLTKNQPFRLEPNKFVLGKTLERVELPIDQRAKNCLAARIEGKSSRARFGLLIHFTAPTVHPGFKGTLTLEMINLGPAPILLVPEMYIAQLIVEEVKGRPLENPSQFQGQTTPEGRVSRQKRKS